jgi:hypothetical protein
MGDGVWWRECWASLPGYTGATYDRFHSDPPILPHPDRPALQGYGQQVGASALIIVVEPRDEDLAVARTSCLRFGSRAEACSLSGDPEVSVHRAPRRPREDALTSRSLLPPPPRLQASRRIACTLLTLACYLVRCRHYQRSGLKILTVDGAVRGSLSASS